MDEERKTPLGSNDIPESLTGTEVTEETIRLKDGRYLILRRYYHTIKSERYPGCIEKIDDGAEFAIKEK